MDERSGRIREMAEVQRLSAEEQAHYVEIPDAELESVQGMNRHERRKWAALKRQAERAAAKAKA